MNKNQNHRRIPDTGWLIAAGAAILLGGTAIAQTSTFLIEGEHAEARVSALGAPISRSLPAVGMVVADLDSTQAGALRALGLTLTPDHAVHTAALNQQSYPTPVPDETGASALHTQGILGSGVTIAFVDTGVWRISPVQYGASGTNDRLLAQYDATVPVKGPGSGNGKTDVGDPSGHGTHVTTIATSSWQNKITGTYEGIAPDAGIVAVQAFGADGSGTYASVVDGINWVITHKAEYNIRVLNLSFSADPQSWYWDDPIDRAVMAAWKAGIVVVAAAGNRGPLPMSVGVPGNVPYVITAGAYTDGYTPATAGDPINTSDDHLTTFSSAGPTYEGHVKPDVLALGGHVVGQMKPGSNLFKAFIDAGVMPSAPHHYQMSGTSMSAAVVSGVVALMLEQDGSLSPDDVKCRLLDSSTRMQAANGTPMYSVFQQGAGTVDAVAAVASTSRGCANRGMNVGADLAGTMHFGGPANRDANGNYYLMNDQSPGSVWDGGSAFSQSSLWVPPSKPGSASVYSQSSLWVPPSKPGTASVASVGVSWMTGLWSDALIPTGFQWSLPTGNLASGQISSHPIWMPQE